MKFFILGHALIQGIMIITLVKQNSEFSLELKTVWKSHLLNYTLENDHHHVSEKDFKIIDYGPWGNNKKRQLAEVILIQEIKSTLNIQDPIAVI